jgi:hypothetical protein
MKIRKGFLKTRTAQPRTCAKLNEPEKNLTLYKPEKEKDDNNEDNVKLLLSLCNSMDELYNNLSKLSNVLEKRIEEHNISQGKGVEQ